MTGPGLIQATPVRHPGRWVAIAVLAVLAAMFLNLLINNPAFDWPFVLEAMIQSPVIEGFWKGTILVTVLAMIFGVALGVVLAVMRLSDNPVLRGVSWLYTWFFRAIPRYVLLTIMGALGVLFQEGLSLGVPFDWMIIDWLGLSGDWRFLTLDANALFGGLVGGVIGLAASEAAYMAEIARAGILSVDRGQMEAAQALGMSRGKAMRRVVLPQAMRVIVPPTGNETIAMLKDTSLLIAIPVTTDLFYQLQAIGARTFVVLPILVAATLYYLIACSVLMIIQSYLEKRFGRGFGVAGGLGQGRGGQGPGDRSVQVSAAATADQPLVRAVNVTKSFGQHEVLKGVDLDRRPGRGGLPARPVRVGQDHLPAADQPDGDPDRRPDLGRRGAGRHRGAQRQAARPARQGHRPAAGPDRHGLPAVQPVPAHDRAWRT